MTDQQPYQQPYEGYDPHGRAAEPQPQAWPGQQPQRQPYDDDPLQHTQQWQGQTWETQTHAPVPPAPAGQGYAQGRSQAQDAGYAAGGQAPAAYQDPYAQQAQGAAARQAPAYQDPFAQQDPQDPFAQQAPQDPFAHGAVQEPFAQPPVQEPFAQPPVQEPFAQPPARDSFVQQAAQDPFLSPGAAPQPAPAAADGSPGPAYGPATLAGNSRITDAQRARLEGRSPIIDPGMQPAALTALLGLLLSGTAAVGSYALLVPLVALQGVTAAGWFRLNGMWPARQGIALAFLGALVADVALLAAGRGNGPAAILGTLGVWVLLCLILQLRSHADPDTRMYGLMATVASSALAIVAGGFLAADPDAVTTGAAAVAVAVLARALPLPTPASVAVSLLAAAGAGIAVGGMTGLGSGGALLGAAAAVAALIGHRVAAYDYPSRFVHFTAGVALPLAASAPVVWLIGRAMG
ncbi:hypothetical protein [Streptomyces mangrovisoli]|uniref:Peptidase C83 domain-containing protein n=1 Tax=Streptomyces mangrovisoli TaxID=1428628 RepID=A0A1J4NU88_9ACTN|nr:hypothetical protein [Streptomyces mangrovisoli]OIJ64813.1 hypothetical protein WN71_026820 [Streptomyces mangrovisoli]